MSLFSYERLANPRYFATMRCTMEKMNATKSQGYIVILDVETTGFHPNNGDEMIELAAQKIDGSKVVATFDSLIIPSKPVPRESTEINGISQELLEKEGKPIESVLDEFVRFINGATLVGHNISFDMSFLNAHLTQLGRPLLSNPTLDTLELARRYLILPGYSLEKVARYLKVSQPAAHRAMPDVETTREVFIKLQKRAKSNA